MKWPLLILTTFLSSRVMAIESIGDELYFAKLEKKQIENMVDHLESSGRLDGSDAKEIKRELASTHKDSVLFSRYTLNDDAN